LQKSAARRDGNSPRWPASAPLLAHQRPPLLRTLPLRPADRHSKPLACWHGSRRVSRVALSPNEDVAHENVHPHTACDTSLLPKPLLSSSKGNHVAWRPATVCWATVCCLSTDPPPGKVYLLPDIHAPMQPEKAAHSEPDTTRVRCDEWHRPVSFGTGGGFASSTRGGA